MEKFASCNYDSYDAIYVCNTCRFKLCPKHFFNHKAKFPSHDISHIEISINNESKEILINFLIEMKKKCSIYHDKWLNEAFQNKILFEDQFVFGPFSLNFCISSINKNLMFLMKTKSIPMKITFRALDYFLIQSPQKALKYVNDFKFPEFYNENCFGKLTDWLVSFNYLKYENKYIYGSSNSDYGDNGLWNLQWIKAMNFIRSKEYEMANEVFKNIYDNNQFNPQYSNMWDMANWFIKITYELIYEKESFEIDSIIDKFNEIENNDPAYLIGYEVLSALYESFGKYEGAISCLLKAELLLKLVNYEGFNGIAININFNLGVKYYAYEKDSKKAISRIKKSLLLCKGKEIENDILIIYLCLGIIYDDLGMEKNIKKLLNIIQKKNFPLEDKLFLNYVMGMLYCYSQDIDKAFTFLWKCIKSSKLLGQNKADYVIEAYLQLSQLYRINGDFKKSHQMIFNAKSQTSILPLGDDDIKRIYITSANFYISQHLYQDALYYLEAIEQYCSDIEFVEVKYIIGKANFKIWNNDKALQVLTDMKKTDNPHITNSKILQIDALIGELYIRQDDVKSAENYFMEAFEIINQDLSDYNCSFQEVFRYFLQKADFTRCNIILEKFKKFVDLPELKSEFNKYLIASIQFYKAQKKHSKAQNYIDEIEKSLGLIEWIYQKTKKIDINNLSVLIDLAEIFINSRHSVKAQAILKFCEEFVKDFLRCDLISKSKIYFLLAKLYFYDKRLQESAIYLQKCLEMNKEYKCYNPKEWKWLLDALDDVSTAQELEFSNTH